MTSPLRLVLVFYVFVTVLTLGASITTPASRMVPSLVLMWALAGVFALGWVAQLRIRWPKLRLATRSTGVSLEKVVPLLMVTLLVGVLSAIRIEFYTGKNIPQVLADLRAGTSLYLQYQAYFKEAEVGTLGFTKIPFVLAGALVKAALIAIVLMVVAVQRNAGRLRYLLTGVVIVSYLLFSLARGTTFEFFEVALLLVLAMILRRKLHPSRLAPRTATYLGLAVGSAAALAIFTYNVTSRGEFRCIGADFCVDPGGILYFLSPGLGTLSFYLASYFGFGTLFTSTLLTEVVFSSVETFLYAVSPLSGLWLGTTDVRGIVCGVHIDCGAAWAPHMAMLILRLGLMGTAVAVFVVARLTRASYRRFLTHRTLLEGVLLYMLVLMVISLPVGNFIFISSSNWIVFGVALAWHLIVASRPARPDAPRAELIYQHTG